MCIKLFFLCGLIPIDPWPGTGPRPGGWRPLFILNILFDSTDYATWNACKDSLKTSENKQWFLLFGKHVPSSTWSQTYQLLQSNTAYASAQCNDSGMTCAWNKYYIVEKTKMVHIKTWTWQEVVLLLDTCCSRTCSKFSWPLPSVVWKLRYFSDHLSFYKFFHTCAINIYSSLLHQENQVFLHRWIHSSNQNNISSHYNIQVNILTALISLPAPVYTVPLGFHANG